MEDSHPSLFPRLSERGMASALSIDHWSAPESSGCHCESAPGLSVNFLSMHPRRPSADDGTAARKVPDKPTAARFQEIFADFVGMKCSYMDAASRHILDDRFDSFLARSKGERDFKEAVMTMMRDGMTDEARNTVAYQKLDSMLQKSMGYGMYGGGFNYKRDNHKDNHKDTDGADGNAFARGARCFSGIISKQFTSDEKGDPKTDLLRRIVGDIQLNKEACSRLRFLDSETGDDVKSILRESVNGDDLDCFIESLDDPRFQEQTKIFRSLIHPPGHVFVCNASVSDIFCDAFLCPGQISPRRDNINGTIPHRWEKWLIMQNENLCKHLSPFSFKRYKDKDRVVTHRHWPWDEFHSNKFAPVPFFVGGEVSLEKSHLSKTSKKGRRKTLPSSNQHIRALMDTAEQFIDVALEELRANQAKPRAGRERYLIAMPVIGTGGGFAGDITGEVVEAILDLLSHRVFAEGDLDVVLVTADEGTYAHAQSIRLDQLRKSVETGTYANAYPCFQWLTDEMRDQAEQLAQLASSGHLSLFMGAGVSMGSGLPSWFQLLHNVEGSWAV